MSEKNQKAVKQIIDILLSLESPDDREEVLSKFAFQLECDCCWIYVTGVRALSLLSEGKSWTEIEKALLLEGL